MAEWATLRRHWKRQLNWAVPQLNANTATDRSKFTNIWTATYNSSTRIYKNIDYFCRHQQPLRWNQHAQNGWESTAAEDVLRELAGVAQGQTQRRSDTWRGSNKRKSYTIVFIKKTLDLLDSLQLSTNQYDTVVKQQGVIKSLEIKWEENRGKILAELTMNKTKKNTGDAKPLKQRRSIAKNRSSRTDKYPLASNLLLAKFKLRRAAGSKVSKLWLKRYEIENWSILWRRRSCEI